VMVAVAVLVRFPEWRPRARRVMSLLALATVAAAVAILPVYLPYRRVAREQGMLRSLDTVADFSATLKGYLASAGRIHFSTWSGAFFKDPIDSFFPGFVVIGLAAFCIWTAFQSSTGRSRVIMLVAIATTGLILSLGTRTPVYGWLFHVFPPMHGLRAAARFGNLFLLGMAVLAGLGLASLRMRTSSRNALWLGVALIAAANLESLRAPFTYARFDGIPPIYSILADEPGPVVLVEAPFYPPQAVFENAPYVLASTAHWRPLMNGYSGYIPMTYRDHAASFWFFPEDFAIQAMRRAGVTHVMVHPSRFYEDGEKVMARVAVSPYLERVAIGRGGMVLYRLH